MKPFWKQLLFLHGHALPGALPWREDAPQPRGSRVPVRQVPPMVRWRALVRTALIGG